MTIKFRISFLSTLLLSIAIFTLAIAQGAETAAVCGYANGNEYSSAPQARGSLCATGVAGPVTGSGPWSWTCTDGASSATCGSGLCGVTFSWVSGAFGACDCATRVQNRSVSCHRNGVRTDPDPSGCLASAGPKPASQQSCTPTGCQVAGSCNNAVQNGCASGTANDGAIADTATQYLWRCDGRNGGANSGQCAKNKPVTYSYAWVQGGFGACSAPCGGGTQTQAVTCRRNDGVSVADNLCAGAKPATSRSCNTQVCAPSNQCIISRVTSDINDLSYSGSAASCGSTCQYISKLCLTYGTSFISWNPSTSGCTFQGYSSGSGATGTPANVDHCPFAGSGVYGEQAIDGDWSSVSTSTVSEIWVCPDSRCGR